MSSDKKVTVEGLISTTILRKGELRVVEWCDAKWGPLVRAGYVRVVPESEQIRTHPVPIESESDPKPHVPATVGDPVAAPPEGHGTVGSTARSVVSADGVTTIGSPNPGAGQVSAGSALTGTPTPSVGTGAVRTSTPTGAGATASKPAKSTGKSAGSTSSTGSTGSTSGTASTGSSST